MNNFEGENADQIWRVAAKAILSGNFDSQNSRLGNIKELLHVNFNIKNPRERWVLSRRPSLNPAFAIAESIWILTGQNNSRFINFWNPILPRFAGDSANYHGAYGYRIRKQFGVDQLQRAYEVLKSDKDSRQVVLQIWDPRSDLPSYNGSPVAPDIPCNICSLIKIRNGRLEWFQVVRSNDLYRGMPYNIIQFTTMQEILAGWLGIDLGGYHQVSDSLHIYEKDMSELFIAEINHSITNTDTLALPKEEYDIVINKLVKIMKMFLNSKHTERSILDCVFKSDLPESYRNMLIIVVVDAFRRNRWYEHIDKLISECTNPVLSHMWIKWHERVR